MSTTPGGGRQERRLVAVSPVSPSGPWNGFALRVHRLLSELVADWRILLIAPEGAPDGLPIAERIEVPADAWGPIPARPSDHPAVAALDRAVADFEPHGLLLWAGTEFLAFQDGYPPAVADRIDCMALISLRSVRYCRGPFEVTRTLSDVLSYARYERRVVRRMRTTVVVGDDDARMLRRLGGGSVHVIGNGVDLATPPGVHPKASDPTVVFSGTLNYHPNVDAVLYFAEEIWPRVLASIPSARFVVAGRSPVPEIVRLADRAGIVVLSDVPDMHAVLDSAWVAVAPMRTGAGIKNKVLEAWAAGLPVVMTSMAANGLNVRGELAELLANRPAAFANLVVRLLEYADVRQRLGVAARELAVREHSWSAAGQRLSHLLGQSFGLHTPASPARTESSLR